MFAGVGKRREEIAAALGADTFNHGHVAMDEHLVHQQVDVACGLDEGGAAAGVAAVSTRRTIITTAESV